MALGLNSKKSVLAVTREVTEATPVYPSSANEYTSLQDGFSFSPAFEELKSAELQASIGTTKSLLGLENPTASLAHYIRHSGVEGQEPDYGKFLEAAFGSKAIASTEYDTVASSTTLIVKVNTGEGVNYQRGQALLGKDGTNGYWIRNVLSVSGDDLTLGQALSVAPAAGVNLGKAVTYIPANENHPTLTLWLYQANGGAIETISGARVTDLTIDVKSGQYVNGNISLGGVSYYFDAINVTATDTKLDFNDGAAKVATVAAKLYKHPADLASAIQTSMNAVSTGITVTYSNSTGKYTIAKASGTLSLLWNTGANAANSIGDKIGYSLASDDTGFLTYDSDTAISFASPQTPAYDSAQPLVAKNNEVIMGDIADITCFGAQSATIKLANTKTDIPDLCAESGRAGSIISSREVTIDVVALLKQYDADKFKRYAEGTKTMFAYNFGEKSGGNWVAGKCANVYCPSATISKFEVKSDNGLVILNMTLKAYVDNGLGEFYLNFV